MGMACAVVIGYIFNVRFRTYEALYQLSYEAPYLGPERGRSGRPTQAVRYTSSGKLGIVKILRYIRSDMYTASSTSQKRLYITQSPNPPNTVLHRSHNETVKLDKENRQGSHQSTSIKSKHHLTQWFSTFFPHGPLLLLIFLMDRHDHLMKKLILFFTNK